MTEGPVDRFAATVWIPAEQLSASSARLEGEAYRHLFRARRLKLGDRLRAVDGAGRAREATVEAIDRASATLALGAAFDVPTPEPRVTLLVAPPRPERASWLVEKCAELGVAAIRWLRSERAPRSYGRSTLGRHRRIAVAAMQQAAGATLPEISGPHGWDEVEALLAPVDAAWVLDPEGGSPPAGFPPSSVALLIGPEGGWAADERERLAASASASWSLGPRVLRIETAAVVAAGRLLTAPPEAPVA